MLASDGRQVRAVAKGLRKPGSRFGARLEPYSVVDLLLHTGRSLEIVAEARIVASHALLREDLDRFAAAAVVADVMDKIAMEGQEEPRLFGLSNATLDTLEACDPEAVPAVVVAFLVKAMAIHGYRPELDTCAACACAATEATTFSLAAGGTLCQACGDLDPATLSFSGPAREWLARLLSSTMAQVAESQMPRAAVSDCFALVRAFVSYHLHARIKALDYYASMPD